MDRGRDQCCAARIRGAAVGAVSATMAVAAHGGAGGALPDVTGVFLLLGLSVILGVLGCATPKLRTSRTGLFALLSAGQLAGHEVLAVSGHNHGSASSTMVGAHAAAVGVCALLIVFAERIGPHCAAALRRVLPRLFAAVPIRAPRAFLTQRVECMTQLRAILAASVSRRGPPLTA